MGQLSYTETPNTVIRLRPLPRLSSNSPELATRAGRGVVVTPETLVPYGGRITIGAKCKEAHTNLGAR